MPGSVIVAGARTPIGRLMGALSTVSAVDLGAHAIGAALAAVHLDPAAVEAVVMGHVVQAGAAPTRHGRPRSAPAFRSPSPRAPSTSSVCPVCTPSPWPTS